MKLFPHRFSTSSAPLIVIMTHIKKSRGRYENMDMALQGQGIVDLLSEQGLI